MPNRPRRRFYHLTTFGCQMNEHDSERIRGVLEESGWSPVDDPEDADLLLFNTCSVRESAESRLKGRLGEASRLKKERPDRLVALGGCFAQSRKEKIFSELPFLDVAFGPQNIGELPRMLSEAALSANAAVGAFEDNPVPSGGLPSRRLSRHHAWVQVMTGCTNFCSYCIVPFVRGPERSRPAGEVVEEVRRLAGDGVVEVTLLGQNVNAYGRDNAGGGEEDFAGLLELLSAIEGLSRVRFTTSHPRDLSDALIAAIRDLPVVSRHLHLPAQSGSSRVLARMKRGYTRERYLDLVDRLYDAIPDLALTTDLIVGFPGEQEEDFYRTMTLAESCRFDGAFTFRYSPRSGTEAAGLPGRVPEVTLKRRMREVIGLIQDLAAEKNSRLVGSIQEVLVEGESRHGDGQFRGRTDGNKIVNFQAPGTRPPAAGEIIRVEIKSSTSTTLTGSIAG